MRRLLIVAALGAAFIVGSGFISPSIAAAGTIHAVVHHHGKHKHKGHKGDGHKARHRHVRK